MKKKIQTLCWVLFTIFSAGCLFINFISEPPVDNVKALTGYMICAAAVSVLYPGAMLFLGLRNRWLYEQLQRKAEVERSGKPFPHIPQKGKYTEESFRPQSCAYGFVYAGQCPEL